MTTYTPVSRASYFFERFDAARRFSEKVRGATSPFETSQGATCYVSDDGLSGYVIRADGDLTNVFSVERGRGDALVESALSNGAETLDCFDGYLPGFYARHGFVEYAREVNWTPGGPDVVFMATPARLAARS